LRRLENARKGNDEIRKSLNALLKLRTSIHITRFTEENYKDMVKMLDNMKTERPLVEGVSSKIELSFSDMKPLGLVIKND